VVTETKLLVPPSELLVLCTPARVTDDTVKALAKGYIVNVGEVRKCNNRLEGIQRWLDEQQELYNDRSS